MLFRSDQAFGYLNLDWKEHVEVDPRYFRPAEVDLLLGDAGKARRELGWEPKVSFGDLVTLMVDHDLKLAQQEAGVSASPDLPVASKVRWESI